MDMKTSELLFKAATLIENEENPNYRLAENSGCWAIAIVLQLEAGQVNLVDGKVIVYGCLSDVVRTHKSKIDKAMEYFGLFKPKDADCYWWGNDDGPRLLALYMAAHMAASDGE